MIETTKKPRDGCLFFLSISNMKIETTKKPRDGCLMKM